MKKQFFASVLALVMALCSFTVPAFAEPENVVAADKEPAKTVLRSGNMPCNSTVFLVM